MNLERIKQEFKAISNIFFTRESNKQFLKVEVNLTQIGAIARLSKKISAFIDKHLEDNNGQYTLEVYSHGTDQMLDVETLEPHLNKNVLVTTSTLQLNGKLRQVYKEHIVIEWYQKGHIKKTKVQKANIQEIKLFAWIK